MAIIFSDTVAIQQAIGEYMIRSDIDVVVGPGSYTLNILEINGGVRIIEQQAEIVKANLITNLTGVYADVYDGTTTVNVTTGGIVLSGAPVGSRFFKGEDTTQAFTLMLADQVRIYEPSGPKVGDPYVVNPKNGVQNYGRVHFATTSGIDICWRVKFVFEPLDGGLVRFAPPP